METKHTPQEWTYSKCPCGHECCNKFFINHTSNGLFEESDAKLIVAAPDMLKALKMFIDHSDKILPKAEAPFFEIAHEIYNKAQDAISGL